jgi:hypothetical protein
VRSLHSVQFTPLLAAAFLMGAARPAATRPAPEMPQTAFQETVVNLAAGRVFIAVAKGAILVGTVEDSIEPDSHPPIPVELASSQLGVILGAIEWIAPASKQQLARLDQELPHLRAHEAGEKPHLGSTAGQEARDLEAIGDGVFNRLNELARNLHGKIDLPSGEPIAVLILADYAGEYGPEVWRVAYGFEQMEEGTDYWTTRVLRPSYVQFWPPEKGQPHTLLEFTYPTPDKNRSGAATASLIELWRQKDPRLQQIAASDARLGDAARGILEGESNKVPSTDATQFFRAALDTTAPRGAPQIIAKIGQESGFAWILAPPAEAVNPGLQPQRPPDAPSLVGPRPSLAK